MKRLFTWQTLLTILCIVMLLAFAHHNSRADQTVVVRYVFSYERVTQMLARALIRSCCRVSHHCPSYCFTRLFDILSVAPT